MIPYLTADEVREIIRLWLEGRSQSELAKRFNVSAGHINNIVWLRKRNEETRHRKSGE